MADRDYDAADSVLDAFAGLRKGQRVLTHHDGKFIIAKVTSVNSDDFRAVDGPVVRVGNERRVHLAGGRRPLRVPDRREEERRTMTHNPSETVFEARQRLAAAGNRASALESDASRLRAENADLRRTIDDLCVALSCPQLSFSAEAGAFVATVLVAGANFKTKKALREAVDASMVPDADRGGDRGFAGIGCYRLGRLGPDMVDGEYRCEGQSYPERHRWRATVVVQSGRVVKVK